MDLRSMIICLATWAVAIEASSSAIDDEIVKFVTAKLDGFLDPPTFSMEEVASAFRVGLLDGDGDGGSNVTRQFLYTKIQGMQPTTDMVYIGLANGEFMGYYKASGGSHTYTFLPHENSSCVAENITSLCRTEWQTDDEGAPISRISSRGDFDPRTREWYVLAQTEGAGYTHEPYTFATTGRIGITYAQSLYNSEGAFVGVAGVDFDLSSFDTLFWEAVAGETRMMFAVENDLDALLGSSIPGLSTALVDGHWTQIRPEQSIYEISATWIALSELSGNFHELDHRILTNEASVRSFEYAHGEFKMIVVSMRATAEIIDHIAQGSFRYNLIVTLGVIGLCITLALAIAVVRLRHTAVWRMAQPPLLLLMLLANVLGYAFVVSNIGEYTRFSCESRNWLFHIALCSLTLSLHTKLDRVRRLAIASAKLEAANEPPSKAIRRVMPFFLILVGWLALWSTVEGVRPVRVDIDNNDGQGIVVYRCSDDYALYFFIPAVLYHGALIGAGCVLAFKTRNLCSDVAESRAINFIFNGIHLTGMIWFGVQYIPGTNVDRPSLLFMRSVLVFCTSLSAQIAIFGPRIYRHIRHGDFTSQEVAEKLKRGHREDYQVVCGDCRKEMDCGSSVTIVPTNIPDTSSDRHAVILPVKVAPLRVELSEV